MYPRASDLEFKMTNSPPSDASPSIGFNTTVTPRIGFMFFHLSCDAVVRPACNALDAETTKKQNKILKKINVRHFASHTQFGLTPVHPEWNIICFAESGYMLWHFSATGR
jgi:hypothetical protein